MGGVKVIGYNPGERQKWLAIEDSVFEGMCSDFHKHNSWEECLKEAEGKLREIKKKIRPQDRSKFRYHAEKAGRRFIEWVGEEHSIAVSVPKTERGIIGLFD